MVEADSGFITEVPGMGAAQENDQQQVAIREADIESGEEEQYSQDEDEKENKRPEVANRVAPLKQEYEFQFELAAGEDQDSSSARFVPYNTCYGG